MSYVIAVPEMMGTAATDVASIGSTLNAAHAAAAGPTTGIPAAAEDEVSAAIAAVFSAHGQGFQALGAQAAAFHDQFVKALSGARCTYTAAEAANASLVSVPGLGPSSAAPAQPLLSSVINGFVNWLNQAINAISSFVNQAVNAIVAFLNQAVNAIVAFLNLAVNAIIAFVNVAVNAISSFVNVAVNAISSFVNVAVNAISSFVNVAVNAVNSVINSLLGLIRGIFAIL